jgi:phage-related protein
LHEYIENDIFVTGSLDELVWIGSTRRDLSEAPVSVRKAMGAAFRTAQQGGTSELARPMRGDLHAVMEVRDDDEAGTYRLMYTTKIGNLIFILDFFQKKSKSGNATPKADLDRIRWRLKKARKIYEAETARQR